MSGALHVSVSWTTSSVTCRPGRRSPRSRTTRGSAKLITLRAGAAGSGTPRTRKLVAEAGFGVTGAAAAGGGGAPAATSARSVCGPTTPSAVRPWRCWNVRIAARVAGPDRPSTVRRAPTTRFSASWSQRRYSGVRRSTGRTFTSLTSDSAAGAPGVSRGCRARASARARSVSGPTIPSAGSPARS